MNYYPFHLGDYAAHTAHLEPMEDLAYRRMLDLYYRTEKPLPEPGEVARLIRMRDHAATIRDVLNEFFVQSPEGYRHARCDEEIKSFRAMAEGGRKGAAKRWAKAGDSHPIATPAQPQCQPEPEPKPEPKKEIQAPSVPKAVLLADGLTEATADAWIAHRKAKKAKLTPIAWAAVQREAANVGWTLEKAVLKAIERNWTGFEAEWVAQAKPAFGQPALTTDAAESTEAYKARMAREAAQARANATKPPAAVVELLKRTGVAA